MTRISTSSAHPPKVVGADAYQETKIRRDHDRYKHDDVQGAPGATTQSGRKYIPAELIGSKPVLGGMAG